MSYTTLPGITSSAHAALFKSPKSSEQQFVDAMQLGDVPTMRKLLNDGLDPFRFNPHKAAATKEATAFLIKVQRVKLLLASSPPDANDSTLMAALRNLDFKKVEDVLLAALFELNLPKNLQAQMASATGAGDVILAVSVLAGAGLKQLLDRMQSQQNPLQIGVALGGNHCAFSRSQFTAQKKSVSQLNNDHSVQHQDQQALTAWMFQQALLASSKFDDTLTENLYGDKEALLGKAGGLLQQLHTQLFNRADQKHLVTNAGVGAMLQAQFAKLEQRHVGDADDAQQFVLIQGADRMLALEMRIEGGADNRRQLNVIDPARKEHQSFRFAKTDQLESKGLHDLLPLTEKKCHAVFGDTLLLSIIEPAHLLGLSAQPEPANQMSTTPCRLAAPANPEALSLLLNKGLNHDFKALFETLIENDPDAAINALYALNRNRQSAFGSAADHNNIEAMAIIDALATKLASGDGKKKASILFGAPEHWPTLMHALASNRQADRLAQLDDQLRQQDLSADQQLELLNAKNQQGESLLAVSLNSGDSATLSAYFDVLKKSKLDATQLETLLTQLNANGQPPTHGAARENSVQAIQLFFDFLKTSRLPPEAKKRVALQLDENRKSAWNTLIEKNYSPSLGVLCASLATTFDTGQMLDVFGQLDIGRIYQRGYSACLDALMKSMQDAGLSPQIQAQVLLIKDANGDTGPHRAVAFDKLHILQQLKHHIADWPQDQRMAIFDAKNAAGETLLERANNLGFKKIAALLDTAPQKIEPEPVRETPVPASVNTGNGVAAQNELPNLVATPKPPLTSKQPSRPTPLPNPLKRRPSNPPTLNPRPASAALTPNQATPRRSFPSTTQALAALGKLAK